MEIGLPSSDSDRFLRPLSPIPALDFCYVGFIRFASPNNSSTLYLPHCTVNRSTHDIDAIFPILFMDDSSKSVHFNIWSGTLFDINFLDPLAITINRKRAETYSINLCIRNWGRWKLALKSGRLGFFAWHHITINDYCHRQSIWWQFHVSLRQM